MNLRIYVLTPNYAAFNRVIMAGTSPTEDLK
jgi:hypothetical protein